MTAARRNRTGTAVAAAAVLATASLALAGCGGGDEPGADGLEKMTVVTFLPLESFTFTPEMYAYAGGYFEDHGLDVTLEPVKGTSAAVQSVIGGAADVTRVSSIDSFPPMSDGQPIVPIGAMAYTSNLRMVSTEDAPLDSGADLEGKTIGMGSVGGTSEKMLDLDLDASGVDRDAVVRQAVPVTGATLELVKQGKLDGYIVSLDTSIQMEHDFPEAHISEAGLVDAPDIQTWLATEDALADPEKSEKLKAFLAAIRDAVADIVADADNDYANVIETIRDSGDFDFPALHDDEVASEALAFYATHTWVREGADLPILGYDEDEWQRAYDVYTESGLIDGGDDPLSWLNSDLLPDE